MSETTKQPKPQPRPEPQPPPEPKPERKESGDPRHNDQPGVGSRRPI